MITFPKSARFWLGVVSRSHVQRGVAGGFAQLCHGKSAPLKRMQPGDGLIYYSPKTAMDGGDPLRAFTAVGRVVGAAPYVFDMGGGFCPNRLDVDYFPAKEVSLASLASKLRLTQAPNLGLRLRRGHLELDREDFFAIAAAMQAEPAHNADDAVAAVR